MNVEGPRITQRHVEARVRVTEGVASARAGHPDPVHQRDQHAGVAQISVQIPIVTAGDVELDADIGDVVVGDGANGAGIGPASRVAIRDDAAIYKAGGTRIAIHGSLGREAEKPNSKYEA